MISTVQESALGRIKPGSHVAWSVRDPASFGRVAEEILRDGNLVGEMALLFGPAGSKELEDLHETAAATADPHRDFLKGGAFDPDTIYRTFREANKRAKAEGYKGLRVVADMDWMLPSSASDQDVIAFELLLDRVIKELDATVVCAYRASSFDDSLISGVMSVHPVVCGGDEPPFRIVACGENRWKLFGEVDLASMEAFKVAVLRAAQHGDCVLDLSDLRFIDVAGMRTLATSCAGAGNDVMVTGASDVLRRVWTIAGCDEVYSLN